MIFKKIVYAIVACIIGYVVLNMVLPKLIFTDLEKLKKPETTLNVNRTSSKIAVPITKGACSLDKSKEVISTYDFTRSMYVDLKPSQNRIGGTQFSYSFWLRKTPGSNLGNLVLFFRGNEIKSGEKAKGFVYEGNGNDADVMNELHKDFQDESSTHTNNRFIKCPLVRFKNDSKSLRIEFNTLKNPHMYLDLDAEVFEHITSTTKNVQYSLISIAFQDNVDYGGIERGIKVEISLNDTLVKTKVFEDNALRLNKGPIVLLPNNSDEENRIDADMVNLTYYNYALENSDVLSIYQKGIPTESVCRLPDSWTVPQKTHRYHKLDLHNELHQI